jgi:hypothetical protein
MPVILVAVTHYRGSWASIGLAIAELKPIDVQLRNRCQTTVGVEERHVWSPSSSMQPIHQMFEAKIDISRHQPSLLPIYLRPVPPLALMAYRTRRHQSFSMYRNHQQEHGVFRKEAEPMHWWNPAPWYLVRMSSNCDCCLGQNTLLVRMATVELLGGNQACTKRTK